MSMVRVHNLGISLDGYATGAGQSLDQPFGHAGSRLVDWMINGTRMGRRQVLGEAGGLRTLDDAYAEQWRPDIGVEIMGRNKFGPQRGPWTDHDWRGWWGEEPPFGTPVVVLTHHVRPSIEFANGTVFHFLDASPVEALAAARELAAERDDLGNDVRIGGGPTTVREFLAADLVDHLHLVMVPIVLGRGERLWDGLEGIEQRFHTEVVASPSGVAHVTLTREAASAA